VSSFQTLMNFRRDGAAKYAKVEYLSDIQRVANALRAMEAMIKASPILNDVLETLYASAVKNNDQEAIQKVEALCKQFMEVK